MKTLNQLFLSILILILFSTILYSQMNFPLHTGDKFVYYYSYSEWWWGGGGTSGHYNVAYRILKDSTFNGKRYFLFNSYPYYSNSYTWVRFDTATQSIYAFDSANTCSYYFREKLIDSLAMTAGSSNSCSNKTYDWSRTDTIYNVIGLTKSFHRYNGTGNSTLQYNSNFGIIRYEDFSYMGSYGHQYTGTMIGCFINGIKYGDTIVTDIREINKNIPTVIKLSQNYPNPFNPNTKIKFDVTKSSSVKIVVYDVSGREVQTLVNERLNPGTFETTFDGSQFTSGVYFYKMVTEGYSETRKMLLIK